MYREPIAVEQVLNCKGASLDKAAFMADVQFNDWLQGIVRQVVRVKPKKFRKSCLLSSKHRYIFHVNGHGYVTVMLDYMAAVDKLSIEIYGDDDSWRYLDLFCVEDRQGILQTLRKWRRDLAN